MKTNIYYYLIQWALFTTTFVITAKFVITSIRSAQKSAERVCFHCYSHVILKENIRFVYLLESPRRGDSNKYTKRMIHKKLFKRIHNHALDGSISSLYNSKFDLTAKSLVSNSVVITRVICTKTCDHSSRMISFLYYVGF